jgi:hypothetical protein
MCRFKERDENVKADIFHAYRALLRQTFITTNQVPPFFFSGFRLPVDPYIPYYQYQ